MSRRAADCLAASILRHAVVVDASEAERTAGHHAARVSNHTLTIDALLAKGAASHFAASKDGHTLRTDAFKAGRAGSGEEASDWRLNNYTATPDALLAGEARTHLTVCGHTLASKALEAHRAAKEIAVPRWLDDDTAHAYALLTAWATGYFAPNGEDGVLVVHADPVDALLSDQAGEGTRGLGLAEAIPANLTPRAALEYSALLNASRPSQADSFNACLSKSAGHECARVGNNSIGLADAALASESRRARV